MCQIQVWERRVTTNLIKWHMQHTGRTKKKHKHMNIFSGDLLIYIYIQHMYTYTYIHLIELKENLWKKKIQKVIFITRITGQICICMERICYWGEFYFIFCVNGSRFPLFTTYTCVYVCLNKCLRLNKIN